MSSLQSSPNYSEWDIANNKTTDEASYSAFVNGNMYGFIALFIAAPGCILNLYLFITLTIYRCDMHHSASVLLRSQLLFDSLACFFLLFSQIRMDSSSHWLAYSLMWVIHENSVLMWVFYTASAYSTLATALHRFVISAYPFHHISKKITYVTVGLITTFAGALNLIAYSIELKINFAIRQCLFSFSGKVLSIFWFFFYYVLPALCIVGFYSKSLISLRRSGKFKSLSQRNTEMLVLKNAVVVGAVFVLCCGLNSFTYVLVCHRVLTVATFNETLRYLSWVCTLINSATTPIICLIFLKRLRSIVKQCLRPVSKANINSITPCKT